MHSCGLYCGHAPDVHQLCLTRRGTRPVYTLLSMVACIVEDDVPVVVHAHDGVVCLHCAALLSPLGDINNEVSRMQCVLCCHFVHGECWRVYGEAQRLIMPHLEGA